MNNPVYQNARHNDKKNIVPKIPFTLMPMLYEYKIRFLTFSQTRMGGGVREQGGEERIGI